MKNHWGDLPAAILGLTQYTKTKGLHLSINEEFLAIYSLFFYCVRNQVKQYAAVAICLKSDMYISISSRLL